MKNKFFRKTAGRIMVLTAALGSALLAGPGYASSILFAHVDDYGAYVPDGNNIANMLVNAGHSVTTRFLDSAVFSDYSSFDQIFVYDLYSGSDTSANQLANYAGIANWYNNRSDQNLILDGRIISSEIGWTNANNMSPEDAWIQN